MRYRCIYHAPGLEDTDHLQQMLTCVAAGEQARSLPDVRMKMIIADRRIALVPLSFLGPSSVRARILVHSSPLLDALLMCFEFLWARATPIAGGPAGPPITLGEQDRRLLSILASQAGLQASRRGGSSTARS